MNFSNLFVPLGCFFVIIKTVLFRPPTALEQENPQNQSFYNMVQLIMISNCEVYYGTEATGRRCFTYRAASLMVAKYCKGLITGQSINTLKTGGNYYNII